MLLTIAAMVATGWANPIVAHIKNDPPFSVGGTLSFPCERPVPAVVYLFDEPKAIHLAAHEGATFTRVRTWYAPWKLGWDIQLRHCPRK